MSLVTWWLPTGTQSDEDAAERQADRDLEKVVKGIKHNTIRSVSFRGTQAKSKQFKAVADAMRVNTTIVTMDLSHVKYFSIYSLFIVRYCSHSFGC